MLAWEFSTQTTYISLDRINDPLSLIEFDRKLGINYFSTLVAHHYASMLE